MQEKMGPYRFLSVCFLGALERHEAALTLLIPNFLSYTPKTNMAMENPPSEDVYVLLNIGAFSHCFGSVFGAIPVHIFNTKVTRVTSTFPRNKLNIYMHI